MGITLYVGESGPYSLTVPSVLTGVATGVRWVVRGAWRATKLVVRVSWEVFKFLIYITLALIGLVASVI